MSWWIWVNINNRASPDNWMANTDTHTHIYGLRPSAFGIYVLFFSPLYLSSSVRLDGGRLTFSGFSRVICLGSSPRLWLGHSRTFTELSISHSCCVLRVTVLLESKPSACLRFWMLWTRFSLRLSLCFGALSLSSTSVAYCWKVTVYCFSFFMLNGLMLCAE